tara:strand:- start:266 stop:1183 length:918 start_codon:yes stop_codon:yes gene_type:complete
MEIKNRLSSILDNVFKSKSVSGGANEIAYCCPFCNHHKPKLQINVETQQWHCWVCDAKGKSVFSLAKKLKAAKSIYQELEAIYKNSKFSKSKYVKDSFVKLPEEYIPMAFLKSDSLSYGHAKKYLDKRGITEEDIIKYSIGYCVDGDYGGRIIVPSYDSNGNLNYFVARSFYNSPLKYKNPPAPKDTIIFDMYINWNMPVILCEGVFDAMAIKKNAVPLLGKTVQDTLLKNLINNTKEVIVCLDADAQDTIYKVTEKLLRNGVKVSRVNLTKGDPSDLGFKVMNFALTKAIPVNEYDLIRQKINI